MTVVYACGFSTRYSTWQDRAPPLSCSFRSVGARDELAGSALHALAHRSGWSQSLVPPALSIDTFEGSAWLGVVPFDMTGVRPHFLPAVPGLSHFPEINLRTYVTAEGRPGIWFFSLDAHSRVAVRLARGTFHLPYFDAEMSCHASDDEVDYRSLRTHRGAP